MSARPLRNDDALTSMVYDQGNGSAFTSPTQRGGYHSNTLLTPPHTTQYARYAYNDQPTTTTPIDKTLLSPNESLNESHIFAHGLGGGAAVTSSLAGSGAISHPAESSNLDRDGRVLKNTPSKHPRLLSLDAFRGLTIAWMIMADDFGGIFDSLLDHSPWNEIRFADFVFPAFVFIVGMAIPMSTRRASVSMATRLTATKRVLWRAIKLIFVGIFASGIFGAQWNLATMRIPGILQRIGACYFFAALIHIWIPVRQIEERDDGLDGMDYGEIATEAQTCSWFTNFVNQLDFRIYRKYAWQILAAFGFLLAYILITFLTKVPGCPLGSLDPGCCAARYWDVKILGYQHMYDQPTLSRWYTCSSCYPAYCPIPTRPAWCDMPFDPEGCLSTLAAIVSCCCGLFFGHVLEEEKNHHSRLKQWLSFSWVSMIIGLIVHFTCMPMNKNIWSVSFVLVMAGVDGIVFSFFYWFVDMRGFKRITHPLICMGMNAILVYLWAEGGLELDQWLSVIYVDNDPNKNIVNWFQSSVLNSAMGADWGGFTFTLIKVATWLGISTVLAHFNFFWKL